jgi:indolepyruvate ferredoxin oxidoreductase
VPQSRTLDQAPFAAVRLADRYDAAQSRIFVTGTQALVRAALNIAWRDRDAGLTTGGFVSGYRGSPLGSFDRDLTEAAPQLTGANIHFTPGVNEELAATAIWGSQQLGLFPGARAEGVFGIWYGKGPGVDRAGDALKHANLAGTAPKGGALAVAGDDHAGVSSTTAHQSEFAFIDAQIPVLAPASVQEILDLTVAGIEMSRAAGLWVALKCPSDIIEQAAAIDAAPERHDFAAAAPMPDLHIRWPDRVTDAEARLAGPKLAAARAFLRANGLDRALWKTPDSRIGIIAGGKAWADLREALDILGLDEAAARAAGIALYKPALVWPLEPEGLSTFAEGLNTLIVVEEKRSLIEPQIRDILYDAPSHPRVIGKGLDGSGALALALAGPVNPRNVARALAPHLGRENATAPGTPVPRPVLRRPPHFCSGCPHNTSTRVPEGSRALAGIGCHTLALWSDPNTQTLTQMGGEGASWIGQAPFTDTPHVFANIGDGTYYHSGLLAIRAAISAGVNITYKLLFNDAVAMTGGQKVEGGMSVPAITRELAAEGVGRIIVVAEDPGHYDKADAFAPGVAVMGRDGFDCAQRELTEIPGVSVLIFDQACAAEKRRRRRRGTLEDPARYVFINERVCEGCGDCQRASHCLSVVPVATPFGEKRRIDMASCNKDETCIDGFCPAIVTVEGGRPRQRKRTAAATVPEALATLPAPEIAAPQTPWRVLCAGIGGTGVVTVGHLIAMAAHLDGLATVVLDQTGLAQKGGSVASHVTIAEKPDTIGTARIAPERADVVIGCDLVVAQDAPQLDTMRLGRTHVVVNTEETITGAFLRNAAMAFPADSLLGAVAARAGRDHVTPADARRLAERLTGAAIVANVLLLGLAWQKGLIPVSEAALKRAIELNGQGVATNLAAFDWGRRAAHDMAAVRRIAGLDEGTTEKTSPALDDVIDLRARALAAYGDATLARTYRDRVQAIAARAEATGTDADALTRAVAEGYFHVLAAKDEYEVARLFTDGDFDAALAETFEGNFRVHYHLAPGWLAGDDPKRPQKRDFGPWLRPFLGFLARFKGLRGGFFDPFRATPDRTLERRHRAAYEEDLDRILTVLSSGTFDLCLELARLPLMVRGFGPVRRESFDAALARRIEILQALGASGATGIAAQ